MKALFAIILCLASSAHAAELEFFGFRVGEDKTTSLKNMKARDLIFVDSDQNANNTYARRSVSASMRNREQCIEEGSAELKTTTCSIGSSDVQQIVLYHLNGQLVRIVAQFRATPSESALTKLTTKYGSDHRTVQKEFIGELEKILSDPRPSLTDLLSNPFGYTKRCDQCSLSFFVQSNEDDHVFLIKDPKVTALTLFNGAMMKKQVDLIESQHAQQKNLAEKNRDF